MAAAIEAKKSGSNPDGNIQGAILKRFLDMKAYGLSLRTAQTAINFKANNLGKSTFDVIEKKNALIRLATVQPIDPLTRKKIGLVSNLTSLVGHYKPRNESTRNEDLAAGYVDLGSYMVRPTTYVGAYVITATMTAYNLWQELLPYDSTSMRNTIDEIMKIGGATEEVVGQAAITAKQHIVQSYRKYLNSSNSSGIIGSNDNVGLERTRLSIDSETNVSLPRYLKALKNMNIGVVNEFIRTNKLLNKFEYEVKRDGVNASRIIFKNAQGSEYDDQELYDALSVLLTARTTKGEKIKLPKLGNKEYTLDTLAQDIIAYAMICSSTQMATEFSKFIPMSYLNAVNYSTFMRQVHENIKAGRNITKDWNSATGNVGHLDRFTIQYFQHYPEKIRNSGRKSGIHGMKLDRDTMMKDNKVRLIGANKLEFASTIQLTGDAHPSIIAIYDQFLKGVGGKKFHLFLRRGDENDKSGIYQRIPVVGAPGFDEFSMSNDVVDSVIGTSGHTRTSLGIPSQSLMSMEEISNSGDNPEDMFRVNSNKMEEVLGTIAQANLGQLSKLAGYLTPFMNHALKGGIKYADSYTDSISGQVYTSDMFDGVYQGHNDSILISSRINNHTQTKGSRIILHETVHGLTRQQMAKYVATVEETGEVFVKPGAPAYVTEMIRLYNDVRTKADQKKLVEALRKVGNKGTQGASRLTETEFNEYYGLTGIYEFMAEALSNPLFQQFLNRTEFKQSGRTFLQKFVDIIKNILESIGVKFPSDSAAYQAIYSVFEFIEAENPKGASAASQFQANQNATGGIIDDFMKDMGLGRGDPNAGGVGFSVATVGDFPDKKLIIRNLNCN
jgi:hypothetical protein